MAERETRKGKSGGLINACQGKCFLPTDYFRWIIADVKFDDPETRGSPEPTFLAESDSAHLAREESFRPSGRCTGISLNAITMFLPDV